MIIHQGEIEIPIEEIEEAQKHKTSGFLQNSISVKTPEWDYKFTVVNRELWLEMIQTTIGLEHKVAS